MKAKAIENKEKHEFALFVESLSVLIQGKKTHDTLVLIDEKLVHRMVHVLRLKTEDTCILFDRDARVLVAIVSIMGKKQISVAIHSVQKVEVFQPTITFLLPLLKRDDYESALYGLAEVGINTIQLIFTQKATHNWSGKRDSERAERILISAAEQSKNFAYPQIKDPISLQEALEKYDKADLKVFFDPQGEKLFDVIQSINRIGAKNIVLLVGPEGDLHVDEKEKVRAHDFIFCALTPTIMRAVQAASLGAGFVRSIF